MRNLGESTKRIELREFEALTLKPCPRCDRP